jgi:homogentisate 1,2-dioxygenase
MMGAGSPGLKNGLAISIYNFTESMLSRKQAMYSADGDMIIVPQLGSLRVTTEMGALLI